MLENLICSWAPLSSARGLEMIDRLNGRVVSPARLTWWCLFQVLLLVMRWPPRDKMFPGSNEVFGKEMRQT